MLMLMRVLVGIERSFRRVFHVRVNVTIGVPVNLQVARAMNAPRSHPEQRDADQTLAIGGNRVDGQPVSHHQQQQADGEHARRVSQSPLQAGAPLRPIAIGRKRGDGRKMIRAGQDVNETGGYTGKGCKHVGVEGSFYAMKFAGFPASPLSLDRLHLKKFFER